MELVEKLLRKLNENPEFRKAASKGFKERQESLEKQFKIQAKKRAPDQEFYNRSYNI
jgi:hypothetical protein